MYRNAHKSHTVYYINSLPSHYVPYFKTILTRKRNLRLCVANSFARAKVYVSCQLEPVFRCLHLAVTVMHGILLHVVSNNNEIFRIDRSRFTCSRIRVCPCVARTWTNTDLVMLGRTTPRRLSRIYLPHIHPSIVGEKLHDLIYHFHRDLLGSFSNIQ